ncbi:M1 family metallopeptidase [Haliangium sp. UPWRP_2]|uniref:M1 family metallopeptidase n=1 Tax=Haliangium sp. UPWRP_2 TaxID=1931276 RepID=UPI000B54700E|nr:M1 family metallopeptidase [Haliangium sp. UPWRP_2]PSM31400.1 peptidase M1 [Haliangium sp. UPWRP_2]
MKKLAGSLVVLSAVALASWSSARHAAPPIQPPRPVPKPPLSPAVAAGATAASAAAKAEPASTDDIPFVSPHAAAVTTPSAPTAWGGERKGTEPTLSDRVVRYEIAATVNPTQHTVTGQEKLTWRNRSDRTVRSIYLHLYLNAFQGPGSTFYTERRNLGLSFRQDIAQKKGQWGHIELTRVMQGGVAVPVSFVHPDEGPSTDQTVVRLDLPTPVVPGGTTTVDIDFLDQLPRVVARAGWFGSFHMVAQWFPKIGVLELAGERGATAPRWNVHEFHLHSEFYADWGEYDVRITVPRGFQVAAAGQEASPPVLTGEQVTYHFAQGDIHDFSFMTVDNYEPPLQAVYRGPGSPEVTVKVFYPAEYRTSAERALPATLEAIRYFSEKLGPYPYRTSTCIVPPYNATEAGGMEYQTLFTSIGLPTVEPDTLYATAVDLVTVHEFGHGYFYGLLASNEFEEPFLDEGLNDFFDLRLLSQSGRTMPISTPRLKLLGINPHVDPWEYERVATTRDSHPADPLGQNAWDRLSSQSYGQVYARTATMMHDLEAQLGTPAIERAFKLYYQRWHFRHPSAADLREALAEGTGARERVEQVFREQVLGTSAVDDRIESLVSEEELPLPGSIYQDGKWTELTEEAVKEQIKAKRAEWKRTHPGSDDDKRAPSPFPYRTTVTVRRDGVAVPQTLLVRFADGSTETAAWNTDERWRRFVFVKPVRAESAELDPGHRIFLDSNKLNDGRNRESDGRASRRYASDAAAVIEALSALVWSIL